MYEIGDIEEFALFSYEEFSQIVDVSEEVFEAFNAMYFKVAIGKGLIDVERLQLLVSRYDDYLV